MTALFRELRRELASGDGSNVAVDDEERDRIAALNRARREGSRKHATLQYAWCLEPHQSGWPHLHFVTNASFVRMAWLKEVWSRIIGAEVRWAKYVKVFDQDGVCSYMSAYIAKTTFSPDIAAIMYRRRQWASTVPKPEVKKAGWEVEDSDNARDLFLETAEPEMAARPGGWSVKLAKAGEYAVFERLFSLQDWAEYKRARHERTRLDKDKVYLEDPVYDEHVEAERARVASTLDRMIESDRRSGAG